MGGRREREGGRREGGGEGEREGGREGERESVSSCPLIEKYWDREEEGEGVLTAGVERRGVERRGVERSSDTLRGGERRESVKHTSAYVSIRLTTYTHLHTGVERRGGERSSDTLIEVSELRADRGE